MTTFTAARGATTVVARSFSAVGWLRRWWNNFSSPGSSSSSFRVFCSTGHQILRVPLFVGCQRLEQLLAGIL